MSVQEVASRLLPDNVEEQYPALARIVDDGALGEELARLLVNAYRVGQQSGESEP